MRCGCVIWSCDGRPVSRHGTTFAQNSCACGGRSSLSPVQLAHTQQKETRMDRILSKTAGLVLALVLALAPVGIAQPQHEQHHPGGTPPSQGQPAEKADDQAPMMQQMQG